MDYANPIKKSPVPFQIPYRTILGAGPTNCSPDVMRVLSYQPIIPLTKFHFQMFHDIKKMLRYVYQTKNPVTLLGQTAGSGGNETMIVNLADPGETIIICNAGVWAVKVIDMANRYNLNVIELKKPDGEVFTVEELEEAVIKYKPVTLMVTHGESSGGTLQPLEGIGKMCHKYNCLFAVDAVVSVGVTPIFVDRWEIDAINGGSQKGIGAPAGMCLLSFSPKAFEKRLSKKHPPPYTLDIKTLADVWDCFDKGTHAYIYTYNSCMVGAVRQALLEICEEGLENVWNRHKTCGELLAKRGEEELGLKQFVSKPENRFYAVSFFILPEDVKWPILLKYCLDKYNVDFSYGIGPTYNKTIRVGLLGQNAKPEMVDFIIEILGEAIPYLQNNDYDGDTITLCP